MNSQPAAIRPSAYRVRRPDVSFRSASAQASTHHVSDTGSAPGSLLRASPPSAGCLQASAMIMAVAGFAAQHSAPQMPRTHASAGPLVTGP